MTLGRLATVLLVGVLLVGPFVAEESLDAQPGAYPDGAQGYLLTALEGDEIVRIPLTYVGAFENFLGPGYDIHLVRLEGPIADHVGVAAGMSGSPVYIEGRLIGALAYRLGQLPKEAIAGVTPIEAMRRASGGVAGPAPDSELARPIATPLSSSGLHPQLREWAREQLESLGVVWTEGSGSTSGGSSPAAGFEPGSPIGVALVRGDWSFAATGTVTAVEDGNVYAFGHPFLGTGEVSFPMYSASVVHTLADAAGSRKLAMIGDERGAITDDRLTAIVGRTDRRATMIPMAIRIHTPGAEPREVRVEIADAPGITPLLAGMSVSNSVLNRVDLEAISTTLTRGTIRMKDRPDLPFEMAASADNSTNPMVAIAFTVQQTLAALWNNPYERPQVEAIDVDVDVLPEIKRYFIESLQYDREPVRPGQTIRVQALLKSWRGEPIRRELELQLPHGTRSGSTLRLAVGSPDQIERALGNPLAQRMRTAEDLSTVLRVLGEMKSSHRLVAVLYDDSPTVVRDGAAFSRLPATAVHLLSTGARTGAASRSRVSRLATTQVELDGPISGGLTIGVRVDAVDPSERPKESPE